MKTEVLALPASRARLADFVTLAKPRLNFLVIITTAAAFYLGAGASVDLLRLLHTVVGTALVAAGAAALNQVRERDVDARMTRTRTRPLPDGRLQPIEGVCFGLVLATLGVVQLAYGATLLAAALALLTLVVYTLIYTPLKRRTHLATVVGAIPGALPPMIGWAAARNAVDLEAWILFAIVFLWQMPHFLAIAWLYRDDYARAGLPMLSVVDPQGRSTARQVLVYAAALIPISLTPTLVGLAGGGYFAGALGLGGLFFGLSAAFAWARTPLRARLLFIGSITYLPALWILMIGSRVLP